jgi:hypothetical protein
MILKKYSCIFSIFLLLIIFCLKCAYASAPTMDFTVNMSEAVTVDIGGGTPRIAVDVGGVTRYATYASGTGTSALTFTYTATAGDVDLDGVTVSSPIDLNGGTITDLSGNALSTLTFTPPTTTNVKVDYPSLSMDFTNGSTGRYTLDGTIYTSLSSFLTATGGTFSRSGVGTYFDSTGTLQTAASGVARFDYDPTSLQARGILIEESRTNSIRNSTMVGAVAGSPGTIPTNWSSTIVGAGLNYEIISTGTSNGIPFIDVRIYGNASSAFPVLYFESSTQIAALTGQSWTISGFIQRIAGSMTNINSIHLRIVERTSGGSIVRTNESAITVPTSGTLSSGRMVRSFTFSGGATTAYAHPGIRLNVNVSLPMDVTLRIGGVQLEQGSFSTSFIPTTSSVLTRSADSFSFPISSWFNASESTLYGRASTAGINSASTIADINNNAFSERFQIRYASNFTYSGIITTANTVQSSFSGGTTTANTQNKLAISATGNDGVLYANGTLRSSDSSISMPTAQTQMRVGGVSSGSERLNGHLQNIKYYPKRILNTQLQLLTQ